MKNHIFLAFKERSFLFLWIGEVFTQLAGNLFTIYLVLTTFPLTKSNTAVSGVVLTFTLPAIIFGVLAGTLVDRWNKKNVLVITNILRALAVLILAFVNTNLIVIYLVSLIVSLLTQFFIPAETPIIPQIVKSEHLYSANALFGLAINGSMLLAYVISGAVLVTFGPQGSLFSFALLLLLGSLSIFFVKYQVREGNTPKVVANLNWRKELRKAFLLLVKTKKAYSALFLLALTQTLVLILATITPGYATDVLHVDISKFPIIFVTPAAIGMFLGALVLINKFHNVSKEKIIVTGLFLSGICMVLLPFGSLITSKEFVLNVNRMLPHFLIISDLHIVVVLAFILGLANSLVFVPANTMLQESATDDTRGKLYGLLNSIVGIFSLLPIIAVGGLSDLLGVKNVVLGIGVCLLFIGLYEYILQKRG